MYISVHILSYTVIHYGVVHTGYDPPLYCTHMQVMTRPLIVNRVQTLLKDYTHVQWKSGLYYAPHPDSYTPSNTVATQGMPWYIAVASWIPTPSCRVHTEHIPHVGVEGECKEAFLQDVCD